MLEHTLEIMVCTLMRFRETLGQSPPCSLLGPCWGALGSYGTSLRPHLGHLASLFELLGALLDYRGSLLRSLGSLLGFPYVVLLIFPIMLPCRQLPSWAHSCHLGSLTWALLGPSWVHLGASRGPSWTALGSSWTSRAQPG